ncbi:hypothetical protein ACKKBG_A21990 [Auxenochlorella protothecoides x Auxenochlorella symbiontica]
MASLEAFRQYDFEGDETWKAYLSRVEIPSGSEDALLKLKAKYYKREIDPDFEPSSVAKPAVPAADAASQAAASATARPAAEKPANAQAATARPDPPGLPTRSEVYIIAGEWALVLMAILSLQPFLPRLAHSAFTLTCQLSLLTNGLKLCLQHGTPSLSPFPAAIMPWMAAISGSAVFFPTLLSVILSSNRHLGVGVLPLAIHALLHADAASHHTFGTKRWYQASFGRVHALVEPRLELLRTAAAAGEVGLGFTTLLSVVQLGLRGAGTAFVIWNQLKLRYQSGHSGHYHKQVWLALNQRAAPILQRVPILQRLVGSAQGWFNRRA